MWRGLFGFISFLRSYVHTRAFLHTYIYIYIHIYICGEDLLGLFRSYAHMSTRVLSCTRTYIYIFVERSFWVYFVPTLICPHACFLAHVHIYIYICSKNGHEPVRKLLNHPRVRVPSSRFENKLLI